MDFTFTYTNAKSQISAKKADRMKKLCSETDIETIISGNAIDTSFKIALVLSIKLGWKVTYDILRDDVAALVLSVPLAEGRFEEDAKVDDEVHLIGGQSGAKGLLILS